MNVNRMSRDILRVDPQLSRCARKPAGLTPRPCRFFGFDALRNEDLFSLDSQRLYQCNLLIDLSARRRIASGISGIVVIFSKAVLPGA